MASAKTAQTKGQTTQGAGGAVSLSAVNANIDPAALGQLFNQLIQSEQYGNLVKKLAEEATLIAGIQTGVHPPTRDTEYSVFGVMRAEFTTDATQAKDAAIAVTRSDIEEDGQLKAVAEQLIHQSDNVKELEQNANLIIAGSGLTSTLSDADLKKLQSSLIFLQKITLLVLAGIALSSIGAKNNPEIAAENFVSLTQSPEAAAAALAPTSPQIAVPSSTASRSVPQEAINVFSGLPKPGASLGAAVNGAIAKVPLPLPTTLEALGLGKVTSEELSQLLQASFSPVGIIASLPNGRAQFDQIVTELQKAGFVLPPELSPENPDFIKALLNQVDQKLPPSGRADLVKHVVLFLRSLNLPEESIAGFKAGIASGVSIGSAAINTLNGVVGALLRNLNVNLQAIPDNVRAKLEAQANTTLAPLNNLSPSDKLSLSLAIGLGLITQEAGKKIAKSLADIATLGATPKTASEAVTSFPTTTVVGGDPQEIRHPSTMPKDTVTLFHERFSHLTIDEDDRRYLEKVTQDFGRTVVTQHDFYQFSINFLLDPAKSILKNFSMITAEQGSGGHIPPDQMRIAS